MPSSRVHSGVILFCIAIIVECSHCQGVTACDKVGPRKIKPVPAQQRPATIKMALVGWFDIDGDGVSDRERFHEHLAATRASVDIEVDDDGVRRPKNRKIESLTSFLVVGTLVDPATIADPAQRKLAERVAQHYLTMRAEARKAGVRTVSIQDFLSFGSRRRNRWRPSMSGSTEQSHGKTSEIYQRSKRLKQSKSTGQTSKLFGGVSPYDKQVDIPK